MTIPESSVLPPVTFPKPDTDNGRLLRELLAVYPGTAWDCDSRLMMKANSRAADLRRLGWPVDDALSRSVEGRRKRSWGYRLTNLVVPVQVPDEWQESIGSALYRAQHGLRLFSTEQVPA